ncbi:uncharacterized protein [Gorilla gorilla gorilla]|uniref:uncharacterized protein n=1 Tax=Gorilla gorilla gorilla TaxID=9595 RepID=UPI0030090E56
MACRKYQAPCTVDSSSRLSTGGSEELPSGLTRVRPQKGSRRAQRQESTRRRRPPPSPGSAGSAARGRGLGWAGLGWARRGLAPTSAPRQLGSSPGGGRGARGGPRRPGGVTFPGVQGSGESCHARAAGPARRPGMARRGRWRISGSSASSPQCLPGYVVPVIRSSELPSMRPAEEWANVKSSPAAQAAIDLTAGAADIFYRGGELEDTQITLQIQVTSQDC